MRHTRRFFSFAFLALFAGLAFLALNAKQINAQDCEITIENIASPANDTPFDFSAPGGIPSNFTLMDPSDPTTNLIIPFNSGEVILTEEVPLGWRLDGIDCETTDDGIVLITDGPQPNEVTFECLSKKGTVTGTSCSFINILEARNIPTLSEWGLIAMAVVLAIFSLIATRRKMNKG